MREEFETGAGPFLVISRNASYTISCKKGQAKFATLGLSLHVSNKKHETHKDTIQFIAAWEFLCKLQITEPRFIISYIFSYYVAFCRISNIFKYLRNA